VVRRWVVRRWVVRRWVVRRRQAGIVSPVGRKVVSILLIVLGLMVLSGASVAWWLDSTLLNTDRFVEIVDGSLDDPSVRAALVQTVRNDIFAGAVESLQPGVIEASIQLPQFRAIFSEAVRRAHLFLLDPTQTEVSLDLSGYKDLLKESAGQLDPSLPAAIDSTIADLLGPDASADLVVASYSRDQIPPWWDAVISLRDQVGVILAVGLGLILAGVVFHPRRSVAVAIASGLGALGAGVLALVVYFVAPVTPGLATDPLEVAATKHLVVVLTRPFVIQMLIVGVIGATIAVGCVVGSKMLARGA